MCNIWFVCPKGLLYDLNVLRNHEQQDIELTLSLVSLLKIRWDRLVTAQLSTTAWASSGVCLQMSLSVAAAMRLRDISGSLRHSNSRGTAPASTTA